MFRACILLLLPVIARCYLDEVPDPDFMGEDRKPILETIETKERLPGYMKRLIKEVSAKPHLLNTTEWSIFERADMADPQILVDILLKLLDQQSCSEPVTCLDQADFTWAALPGFDLPQHTTIVGSTLLVLFILCYCHQSVWRFTLSLVLFLSYCYSVYSRAQQNYMEMVGAKTSAIEKELPAHCRQEYSLASWMSAVWSTVQVGDRCKMYYTEILSDPLLGIKPLECIFHPLASLPLIPLTALGETLGPFLEKILTPFPFYAQITVLIFLSVTIFSIAYATVSLRQQPSKTKEPAPEMIELHRSVLREVEELRKELSSRRFSAAENMILNEQGPLSGLPKVRNSSSGSCKECDKSSSFTEIFQIDQSRGLSGAIEE